MKMQPQANFSFKTLPGMRNGYPLGWLESQSKYLRETKVHVYAVGVGVDIYKWASSLFQFMWFIHC